MSFWTSQQLELHLPKLIDKFAIERVDCNAYTLRIGDELYVSPTDQTPDPKSSTIQRLAKDEAFTIPPGQFAFLITEEIVRVPRDAMAFISMKARIKFKGLVNVSGFHVDPGFHGKLVFSVFNAGPAVVHLRRGQDCFLIWYASLGEDSTKYKDERATTTLSTDLINALPGELQSLEGLHRKIDDVESRLNERLNKVEPKQAALITGLAFLIALLTSIAAAVIADIFFDNVPSARSTSSSVAPRLAPPSATLPSDGPGETNAIWSVLRLKA